MSIAMVGFSAPYCEAVEHALLVRGVSSDPALMPHVLMIHCNMESRWEHLAVECQDPDKVVIAVLGSLDLDHYARALALGSAGVLYEDTPSSGTAEIVEAAVSGEVVLPRQAAQTLARLAMRLRPTTELDQAERELLQQIAMGRTVVDLAAESYFSERTVRRHLHSLYLKLEVKNRAEAIASAARMGMLD